MLRLAVILFFLALFLLFTIPYNLIRRLVGLFNKNLEGHFSLKITRFILKTVLKMAGTKITVIGLENIPDEAVLYTGNHRGFFDIVLTYSYCLRPTSFISKKELSKVPLLSNWMSYNLHCLFLDRKDPRQSLKTIIQAIEHVKNGISIFIFPEGTRNMGEELTLLPFKEGSFKIATKSNCAIIPVTINNVQAIFENSFPLVKKAHVVVEYGKPIYPSEVPDEHKKHIAPYVQSIIQETLIKNSKLIEKES